jgi:NNP family nitrate/nitrite transporter-like MFS transporter
MSFGSFIGYSAAFPLLIKTQFPGVNPLAYAFLGPMCGALIRPIGGWVSDKVKSGALVTFVDLFVMIFCVFGVLFFIGSKNFLGFFICFILLFVTTGIANGSVFQMIPMIFIPKESAAVLGFSAAIAAYGAFLIPKSFGLSIQMTGAPNVAMYFFVIYYVSCILITWWYYLRSNAEVKC